MGNEAKTNIRTDQFTVRTRDEALQAEIAREISSSGLDSGSALFHELFRRRGTHLPPASLDDRRYIEAAIGAGIADEASAYAASLRACRQLVPATELGKDDLRHLTPTPDPVAPTPAPVSDEIRQLLATLPTREDLSAALRTLEPLAAPAPTTTGTELAELLDLAKTLPTRDELAAAVDRLAAASPDISSLAATLPTRTDVSRIVELIQGIKMPDVPALKLAIASIAERLTSIVETYDQHLDVIAAGVKDLAAKPAAVVDLAPVLACLGEIKAHYAALKADNEALRKTVAALKPATPKLAIFGVGLSALTLIVATIALLKPAPRLDLKSNPDFAAVATAAATAAHDAKLAKESSDSVGGYMANNIYIKTPGWGLPETVQAAAEAKDKALAEAKAKKP